MRILLSKEEVLNVLLQHFEAKFRDNVGGGDVSIELLPRGGAAVVLTFAENGVG